MTCGASKGRYLGRDRVSAVAETQNPIEVLKRAVATLHFEAEHDDNPANWVRCDGLACADVRRALAELEAVVAVAWRDHRDATSHLRPGEFGVVNLDTYASMGCKSCAVLAPFQEVTEGKA